MNLTIESACLLVLLGSDPQEFERLVKLAPDAQLLSWHAILSSLTSCDALIDPISFIEREAKNNYHLLARIQTGEEMLVDEIRLRSEAASQSVDR